MAFARGQAALFFGRDDDTYEAYSLLLSSRAMLLYGQSGAGKSSLVNAGLLPMLEREQFDVLPVARVQGALAPDLAMSSIGNPYRHFTMASWGVPADRQGLLPDVLATRVRARDRFGEPQRRLVVLDQFEELFTAYPEHWPERAAFVDELAAALERDPRLHVLLCVREDRLADVLSFADRFPDRLRTRARLSRLTGDDALAAIAEPARLAGVPFAPGVAERLVEELLKEKVELQPGTLVEIRGEHVEAVQLQVVCSSLWRSLPGTKEITATDLDRFGDVTDALVSYYREAVEAAAQASGTSVGRITDWFERELITPGGTRAMVYRDRHETAGLPNRAVDALEDLHMIRAEVRAGARWYELTHDRFIAPIDAARPPLPPGAALRGLLPLLLGGAGLLSFFVLPLREHPVPGILLLYASSIVAGVGLGLLGAAALDWRALRNRRRVPLLRRRAARITLFATCASFLLAGPVLLTDPPDGSATSGERFADYAEKRHEGEVGGTPTCGGSSFAVWADGPVVSIAGASIAGHSDGEVAATADGWCRARAASQVLQSVVAEGIGAAGVTVSVLPLPTWLRPLRRRRR